MAANSWKKRITQLEDNLADLTLRLRIQKMQGGVEGVAGPVGMAGLPGLSGDVGFAGEIGSGGDQGDRGDVGLEQVGPTGPQGQAGGVGPAGPQGPAGATGANGDPGVQGPAGAAGDVQRLYSKWTNSLIAPSASRVSRSNKALSVSLSLGTLGATGVSFSVTLARLSGAFLSQSTTFVAVGLSGQTNKTAAGKIVTRVGVVSAILTPVLAVVVGFVCSLVGKMIFGASNKNAALSIKSPATVKLKV